MSALCTRVSALLFASAVLAAGNACAQGTLQQGGRITPGHVAQWNANGVIGDGGSAQNGNVKEIGINNSGTPLCVTDAPTSGPYHQLCFGANSLGGGLVSFQAYNGAPVTPLMCNINGVLIACELSGSNVSNIAGPLTVAGNITTSGQLSAGSVTTGSLVTNGTASLNGAVNVGGPLTVAGNITTPGQVSAGNVTTGSLVTNGAASFAGQISAGSVTTGPLVTNGTASLNGAVNVGGDLAVANGLQVGGLVPNGGGNTLYVNGNERVTGSSDINGQLNVATIDVSGGIVAPNMDISQNLDVGGDVSALGLIAGADGVVSNGPLNVNAGGAIISGVAVGMGTNTDTLWVSGNAHATGIISTGGDIDDGGNLSVAGDAFAQSWQITSDQRLKSNVTDFKLRGVDTIKQLRPVSFRFGTGQPHRGLIADEVQKVLPQAVSEHKGVKMIDPMVLIDALIIANRELADRVEALEKRPVGLH